MVENFKNLGTIFYKHGSWNRQQKCLSEYGSFALHHLNRVFENITLSNNEKFKLFDSLVCTVLSYACEVWGFHEAPDVERTRFCRKSRKENPQKLTPLSSRSRTRHLVGKRTAQKDTITDITSDSQVNSNFPYRWSPASLTFNNYFYLFLYLYITRITINNNAPHLKSPKNQNRRAALGRPAIKITGGL